jgi:hypothetical protein
MTSYRHHRGPNQSVTDNPSTLAYTNTLPLYRILGSLLCCRSKCGECSPNSWDPEVYSILHRWCIAHQCPIYIVPNSVIGIDKHESQPFIKLSIVLMIDIIIRIIDILYRRLHLRYGGDRAICKWFIHKSCN